MSDKVRTSDKLGGISVHQRTWAAEVFKELGWQALDDAPKDDSDVYLEPSHRFEERLAQAKLIDREAVEEEVADLTSQRDKIKLDLAKLADTDKDEVLSDKLSELNEQIEEKKTALALEAKIQKRLDQITKIEAHLDKDLRDLAGEVNEMRASLCETLSEDDHETAVETALAKLKTEDVDEFDNARNAAAANIEKARREIFTFDKIVSVENGVQVTEKRQYAVINATEYSILYGMLEKAQLVFIDKGLNDGLAMVRLANAKLAEYRNARTGADAIERPEVTVPKLDEILSRVSGYCSMLRMSGFGAAADDLMLSHDGLLAVIKVALDRGSDNVFETYKPLCEALDERGRDCINKRDQIKAEIEAAKQQVKILEANEFESFVFFAEQKIEGYEPTSDIHESLSAAQAMRRDVEDIAKRAMSRLLDEEDVDLNELRKRLDGLKEQYDGFLKHNRDGSVKMIKDKGVGHEKAAKDSKYSSLPRETLREFELRIQAAELLLETGSVDALKRASGWMRRCEITMGNVENFPTVYDWIETRIKEVKKKLAKISSKYEKYCIAERSDLEQMLAAKEKDKATIDQREMLDELQELETAVDNLRNTIERLQGRKRALEKTANSIEKTLDEIGKQLKKHKQPKKGKSYFGVTKVDGYHGSMRDDLQEIRDLIAKRREDTLNDAESRLATLQEKATSSLKMLNDNIKKRKLSESDEAKFVNFLHNAMMGQGEKDSREEAADEFKEEAKSLKSDIKDLIKLLDGIRSDPTDAKLLRDELDALEKELKGSNDYPDGLKRLEKMQARYRNLQDEANTAKGIVDMSLVMSAQDVAIKLRTLKSQLASFVDGKVKPKQGTVTLPNDTTKTELQVIGDDFERKLKGYVDAIHAAIPDKAVNDLKSHAEVVVDTTKDIGIRKLARKEALAGVRALMQLFDGYDPVRHFGTQPFDPSVPDFKALKRILPRLEIKLLTAIKP